MKFTKFSVKRSLSKLYSSLAKTTLTFLSGFTGFVFSNLTITPLSLTVDAVTLNLILPAEFSYTEASKPKLKIPSPSYKRT